MMAEMGCVRTETRLRGLGGTITLEVPLVHDPENMAAALEAAVMSLCRAASEMSDTEPHGALGD